jgi:hypothetical protein
MLSQSKRDLKKRASVAQQMQKPKKDKDLISSAPSAVIRFPNGIGQCPSCKAWNSLSENRFS